MVLSFLIACVLVGQDSRGAASATTSLAPLAKLAYKKQHALVIGISKYQNIRELRYAHKDAIAIRDVLIESYGYESANVTVLLNEQATHQNIVRAFVDLSKRADVGPDDSVLVYLAGHGASVELQGGRTAGFFLPFDASADMMSDKLTLPMASDPDAKGVRIAQLVSDLFHQDPGPRHVLVVADFCYGGTLVEAGTNRLVRERRGPSAISQDAKGPSGLTLFEGPPLTTLQTYLQRGSREILSAGARREAVYEFESTKHGALTGVLLAALHAMAKEEEPYCFTVDPLTSYAEFAVVEQTSGQQRPIYWRRDPLEDGRFVFAPKGKWSAYDAAQRPSLQRAIREFNMIASVLPVVHRTGPNGEQYRGHTEVTLKGTTLTLDETGEFPGNKQRIVRTVNILDLMPMYSLPMVFNRPQPWINRPACIWESKPDASLFEVWNPDTNVLVERRRVSDISVGFHDRETSVRFAEALLKVKQRMEQVFNIPP